MNQVIPRLWIGSSIALGCLVTVNSVRAQIVPDNTLPVNSGVTPGCTICTIEGGTVRGVNQFHSFSEFSVPTGGEAFFNNGLPIQNIFSRVTGNSVSNIDGLLRTNGTASLFFLNPNGIIFGSNATLNIGGSFVASTASSLVFADGTIFSTEPGIPTSPLLTISVPIGLQYGSNPGSLEVRGANLQVNPGQTLALAGGAVSVNSGQLLAPGGRVELAGVAGESSIELVANGSSLGLSFPDGVPRADVSITNNASVNVLAGGGGSISINAMNLNITGGSGLQAGIGFGLGTSDSKAGDTEINATGAINLTDQGSFIDNSVFSTAVGQGGDIKIRAGSLAVTNGAQLRANTFGQGNAGSLNIIARNRVSFDGVGSNAESTVASGAEGQGGNINIATDALSASGGATLTAHTFGRGNAGSVTISATDSVSLDGSSTGIGSQVFPDGVGNGGSISITTGTLSASNGAALVASTSGQGNGGSINITTGTMSASSGATLAANTFGQGNAGNVTISATDSVSLDGSSTAIASQVFENAVGNGGSITITTGTLSASSGATLVANTSGQGNASNVTIIAPDSVSLDGSSTGIGSQVFENAVGNGGSISITTGTLSASNGATLVANTSGQGNAGNVSIIATDSVSLDGVGKDTQVTGIGSQVLPKGVGNGGNISITARSLAVTNGARLITSTSGQGDGGNLNILTRDTVSFDGVGSNGRNSGAFSSVEEGGVGKGGDINITTDSLRVSNGAQLNASSLEQGNAGNLNLTANSVLLDKGGQLIAETASGEGGNINLQVEDLLLMRHNSLISAQAFNNGNGGNIRIKPGLIVAVPTEDSDIVADAEQGNGGNITITTQGIFGLEFRRQRTPKSEITASSQLGISGTVNITRLTVDPSQGLAALPATLVDRTNQIDQGCSAGGTNRENTFAVTGRGGLPQNPNDLFAPDMVQDDFGTPVVSHRPSRESVKPMPSRLPQQLVEAQGWVVNDLGVVTLVAAAPNVTPHSGALASAPCQIKEKAAKGDEGVVSSEELVPVPR